ncbi:uncharacterized protein TRAVEDRAFT_81046, partial [Trametes versicolor FP-101664 SS1]|uniref:uncharacterized protein n=1 Tax=Trametes versicolor (strain FP-101664) TaxID=717944 RepID=UPI0004622C2A
LSPQDFLRLYRTCRLARDVVATFIKVAFDVNATLKRFVPDPLAFRSLQARTGTLISGSIALQFFDRAVYPESDLDLYVHSQHRREVGMWLLSMGYTFFPSRRQDPRFKTTVLNAEQSRGLHYVMPGVSAIYTFRRQVGEQHLKVQIIVARRAPMEVVLGFHSTCVMNVISYEKAYCLFPRATLEERRSLLSWSSQGRSKRRAEGLVKYASRGFKMLTHLHFAEYATHQPIRSFPLKPRWIGDTDTWVLSL